MIEPQREERQKFVIDLINSFMHPRKKSGLLEEEQKRVRSLNE
jgi:hypothetical protein